jgi:hypothetical protein
VLHRLPSELPGDTATRALRVAMLADRVLAERENGYICDDCLKSIRQEQTCIMCGAAYTDPA